MPFREPVPICRQLVLCEMAQSCLSYGLLVTMSHSSDHSQLRPGFSVIRLVAVSFCLAEVSLFCFDRTVVTLYRRASSYTTLSSLRFSTLSVFPLPTADIVHVFLVK